MKTPLKIGLLYLVISTASIVNATESKVVLECIAERLYQKTPHFINEKGGEKFELHITKRPENIIEITTSTSTSGIAVFFSNAKNWHFKVENIRDLSNDNEYNIKYEWGGRSQQNLQSITFKLSRFTGLYSVRSEWGDSTNTSSGTCKALTQRLF